MYRHTVAAAVAAVFASPMAVSAQDSEIESLRQQIRQLEERLDRAEQRAEQPQTPPAPAMSSRPILGDNTFNPAISLILDGKYRNLQRDPGNYQIGGFIPGGEESGPGDRGFGIDESELTVSANIDPYFSGYFTTAINGNNDVGVEEGYVQNSGFVPGLSARLGRFYSGFGYQNEQHSHTWDFVDLPLVHQAFFGGQLAADGVQLRWVAPTPLFLEVGAETGSGKNFPGNDRNKNGLNGATAYVHVGGDVGYSHSYRVGLSYSKVRAVDRTYDDVDATDLPVSNAFTGDSKLWGMDFVWKWAPEGDPKVNNFKFQAEYFERREDGSLTFDTANASGPGTQTGGYSSKQQGWYAQAVYQFMPRWRAGLRFDQLDSGDANIGLVGAGPLSAADFPLLAANDPRRTSLMVDFSPSEFSRLRVQFSRDEARFAESDNQFFVQYVMSLGAHGAHKF